MNTHRMSVSRRPRQQRFAISIVLSLGMLAGAAVTAFGADAEQGPAAFPRPLPAGTIPRVATLPSPYPKTWAFLTAGNDKIELRDVGDDERGVKGQLTAHESATLLVGTRRPEVYVADTAWSRITRGTRTDFITIYDQRTFAVIGEIVLPPSKRALVVPMQGMFSFADDEKLALVWNFTPASSVTVVDLVQRKVLGVIDTPGCSLAYSTGDRGFATLCQGGTLLRVWLDGAGKVAKRQESKAFNPLDTDPLLTASARVGSVLYFVSMLGRMQPIDFRPDDVRILPAWALVPAAEVSQSWRPSGLQPISSDAQGRLYVIMQRDAHEGSYKGAGTEIWVYDPATRARVRRYRLVRPGTSIDITHGDQQLMLVSTKERLDVYELSGGSLVRSLDAESGRGGLLIDSVR